MTFQSYLYLAPYIFSGLISTGVGIYAFRRRSLPGAAAFGVLALFEAEWTFGYILQLVNPDLGGKLFWNNAQFLGAIAVPLTYYLFALQFSGHKLAHPKPVWWMVWGTGAVLLVLIWSNDLHSLFRVDPHLQAAQPFEDLVFTNGPAFILYVIYAYVLVIFGTYILAANYVSAPRTYRLQLSTVLIGILIPWITTLVTWLELVPARFHASTPLAFAVSNLVVGWALFRYHLFDLVPVAYDRLVESMEDGTIVVDKSLRVVDLNPAAQAILNQKLSDVLGKSYFQILPAAGALMLAPKGDSSLTSELTLGAAGQERRYEIRMTNLYDSRQEINGHLILLRDTTERKQTEEKLRQLAITDPLTGLYNRRYFFSVAESEFERSRRSGHALSILIFDADHFKVVNDTFGHIVGDQVLQALAELCLDSLRKYDVMARYGGEEFVIMLPETEIIQAQQIGERLRRKIENTVFNTKAGPSHITISMGIAALQEQEHPTFDKLLDCADQALYEAKVGGRNLVRVWKEPSTLEP